MKTVYNKVFPAEATDFTSIADAVAASKAQVVVLGSVDVPTVSAFMQAFEQAHYTPEAFIATAGPDQGAAFIKAVGAGNADGMMVPNSWYGGSKNPASKKMVAEYIKQYGGTARGRQRRHRRGLLGRTGHGAGRQGHQGFTTRRSSSTCTRASRSAASRAR